MKLAWSFVKHLKYSRTTAKVFEPLSPQGIWDSRWFRVTLEPWQGDLHQCTFRKPTQKALEPCQGGCRIPRESYEAENFSTLGFLKPERKLKWILEPQWLFWNHSGTRLLLLLRINSGPTAKVRKPRQGDNIHSQLSSNYNKDSNGFIITVVESEEPNDGAQNHTEVSRTGRSAATLRIVNELRGHWGGKKRQAWSHHISKHFIKRNVRSGGNLYGCS